MELEPPLGCAVQAEGLQAGRAVGERHALGGRRSLVGVPAEGLEVLRQPGHERVVARIDGLVPPSDLGRVRGAHGSAGRLGQQLGAEADAQGRGPGGDHIA